MDAKDFFGVSSCVLEATFSMLVGCSGSLTWWLDSLTWLTGITFSVTDNFPFSSGKLTSLLMIVSVSAITAWVGGITVWAGGITVWVGGMTSGTWTGSIVKNQKQNFKTHTLKTIKIFL